MNKIKLILLTLCCVLFVGCANKAIKGVKSVTDAGVSSYHSEPVFAEEGQTKVGDSTTVILGKEYDSFGMTMTFDQATKKITGLTITANGVSAAEGQATAADAVVQIQNDLSAMGVEITDAVTKAITSGVLKATVPTALFLPDMPSE